MTTMNHEYYVSFEVAKLLKEVGFDWECRGIYVLNSENDPEYVFSTANFTNTSKEIEGYIRLSAPTLDVAQRWLREVKNVDVFAYRNEPKDKFESIVSFDQEWSTTGMCINTYEEALEAGIKECLTLLLKENE